MGKTSSIVTPIALDKTSSALICTPWFVQLTEYPAMEASYRPLVNGEEAFGALYNAIENAKHTIDYICWGFQPSMYFRRDGGNSLCIGDLLVKKGQEGVKVRLLVWADSFAVGQFIENENPGYDLLRSVKTQNENNTQREYDRAWYYRARIAASPEQDSLSEDLRAHMKAAPPNLSSAPKLAVQPLKNIQLVTRDFSLTDRAEIMYRESLRRADKGLSGQAVAIGFGGGPSHHQKMAIIDYEAPEHAVGFVMGHNTLDAYWDDDAHRYARMNARFGRNGETPRQDMSSIITGPILECLNANFCSAWKHNAKVDLLTKRKPLAARLKVRPDFGTPVMAQITRTQSQESKQDIKSLYLQVACNATKFLYIENQYFRWEPLAKKIKEAAAKQVAWGRDPGKHGSIYLFVVTNSSDDGMGVGTESTYKMLDSLGQANLMSGMAKEHQDIQQQHDVMSAVNELAIARMSSGTDAAARQKAAQKKLDDARQGRNGPLTPKDIPGLKIHICTLVAPDSPGDNWMPVYIHSKIMIIDDVFLTHGSANINTRSMEVDSEINICHEHMGVTQPLRRKLWTIHTADKGAHDDPKKAFSAWSNIITQNASNQLNGKPPVASLVGFSRTSTTQSRMD
ncbi:MULTISPECIES: phospholipase D-like domain-containing protein [unclassified Caballeronia]|uniref:phospholipase D-like domain-containing protein n=1 Tax=unclassified Caballeronia TaxID=2646786 RepID=UPI0028626FF2|nr:MULTISPECIES: phospholipase D-like domain-containing protein [unclassified Caballeronia]MDR5751499.1 phosphatidylserine/phosphatidylglycerophosphate/cardiolipin synthase family protein [Caballeronia sp. LZ024]MDR5844361.1 phosphatidylserine/phosphatidylglycerophosphate/cardiolipin synthase family protein [Caballeronia sp. LZ031]